jgi:hypothetical protein
VGVAKPLSIRKERIMDQAAEKAAALPKIPPSIILSDALHPGYVLPHTIFPITNGAYEIFFTDENGKPIQKGDPSLPQNCAMDLSKEPFPPCNIRVRLYKPGFDGMAVRFELEGTISAQIRPGTYTFYICARNAAGWSNICPCPWEIAPN